MGQVNQAIGNLDQMTQQNAALVEESAAAAQSLREQADQLAQVVSRFKVQGGTASAAPLRHRAPAPAPVVAPAPAARPAVKTPAPARLAAAPAPAPAKAAQGAEDDWESF